jgi:Holliday junction resolvase
MLESLLQRKCIKKLEKAGWYVLKISLCNKNGFPDTIIMREGVMMAIEFKRKGEVPRPLQMLRHKEIREKGFDVMVVDDVEQINKLL